MSHTIADHGYIPEEHAPDPVIGHGDPTAPGKVGIWLFLASEIMFFIGILGSYIILRSGSPVMFSEHGAGLSKTLAGINTLVLILSSLTMALAVDAAQKGNRSRLALFLGATLICAFGFMGIKAIEYTDKFGHHTIVVNDAATKKAFVYDGHFHHHDGAHGDSHAGKPPEAHQQQDGHGDVGQSAGTKVAAKAGGATVEFVGYRMELPERNFDIRLASEYRVKRQSGAKEPQTFQIDPKTIGADFNYAPWRNIFYSCYYALTGIHGLHVIGGIVPISILMIQALRGRIFPAHVEYTGLYWHFVDLVWIFLFPLLYLI